MERFGWQIMCHIYYPFFKLENENNKGKKGKHKKYNHKSYIIALALFSDKILIPTRHLLEMENDKFDILLQMKELFQEDVIYSRIPDNMSSLKEYYEYAKNTISNKPQKIIDIRINKIVDILYKDKTEFEKYNRLEEQEYYSQKMKNFLEIYKANHPQAKGISSLITIWKEESSIINKEEFDAYLLSMKSNKNISNDTFTKIKKASDLLYFIAGASPELIKVCYTPYFEHKCIQNEIEHTISNYDEIINRKYNPEEIINLLSHNFEIIENDIALNKIDMEDIIYLRNQKCFKKFIETYEKYSIQKDFDKYFEKKKNAFKIICIIKSFIVSSFLTIIFTTISSLIASTILISIVCAIISMLLMSFITYLWQTKNRYEIPFVEKILDKIICCFDPVSLYLAKLHWKLANK